MSPDTFLDDSRHLFARLVTGYASTLDHTGIRSWMEGHLNFLDHDGATMAGTRSSAALAAWLSDPSRPEVLESFGRKADVRELLTTLLERAPDPEQPGSWGMQGGPTSQWTVESSVVAYAAWLARETVLPRIDAQHLPEWLQHYSSGPPFGSNWALFWIVNHSARAALDWPYERDVIDAAWTIIEGLHRGDGWMTDGGEQAFDDYNWWVFGSHELFWVQIDGGSDPERTQRVKDRIRSRLEVFPHLFASDGAYPDYGRSLTYTFARLACAVLAHRLGCWPHSAGVLKRLVRLHLNHCATRGSVDRETGIVRQRLAPHGTPFARDPYIDTGHPYWCMLTFAALWQIPDDDAFWTADEDPLPVERGDFQVAVRLAGWVLTGTKGSGHVLRYALGTCPHGPGSAAKYSKFCYGSHFAPDLGLVDGDAGPDSVLWMQDREHRGHPDGYQAFAVDERWLRARYAIALGPRTVDCETVLVPVGEQCVRVHRVRFPQQGGEIRVLEGGSAFGYAPGEIPARFLQGLNSAAVYGPIMSGIAGVSGWDRALKPCDPLGDGTRNARHALSMTPLLESIVQADGSESLLVCVTRATIHAGLDGFAPQASADWADDGTVRVTLDARTVDVPPLDG